MKKSSLAAAASLCAAALVLAAVFFNRPKDHPIPAPAPKADAGFVATETIVDGQKVFTFAIPETTAKIAAVPQNVEPKPVSTYELLNKQTPNN